MPRTAGWRRSRLCGRLVSLWHASYGYRDRVAGRDKGKFGRLVYPGGAMWGAVNEYGALEKRAAVARVPGDGAWLGCPAVSSGGVGGSRLSDVRVS